MFKPGYSCIHSVCGALTWIAFNLLSPLGINTDTVIIKEVLIVTEASVSAVFPVAFEDVPRCGVDGCSTPGLAILRVICCTLKILLALVSVIL